MKILVLRKKENEKGRRSGRRAVVEEIEKKNKNKQQTRRIKNKHNTKIREKKKHTSRTRIKIEIIRRQEQE